VCSYESLDNRALNDKAQTMRESGAEWLCLESLAGLFVFRWHDTNIS
jgi:hypothetical protein